MIPDHLPYLAETPVNGQVFFRFAEICDHTITNEHQQQWASLLSTNKRIHCDLTQTKAMTSTWLLFLAKWARWAKQHPHKCFEVVGMSSSLQEDAVVLEIPRDLFRSLTQRKGA